MVMYCHYKFLEVMYWYWYYIIGNVMSNVIQYFLKVMFKALGTTDDKQGKNTRGKEGFFSLLHQVFPPTKTGSLLPFLIRNSESPRSINHRASFLSPDLKRRKRNGNYGIPSPSFHSWYMSVYVGRRRRRDPFVLRAAQGFFFPYTE